MSAVTIAFFDVDETLITIKSMFGFLRHHLERDGARAARFAAAKRDLAAVAATNGREASNRAYYRLFAGERADTVAARGRRWFAHELAAGGLFHGPTLDAFERHRERGDVTVLVSGSFSACLDPIARHVGAHRVLSSEPVIGDDGRYTGEVRTAMIGDRKASSARTFIHEANADPAGCHAYADHASDLSLLDAVGHPVLVGDDPVLLERARRDGWSRLPGVAVASTSRHALRS
jgi:HAD superfamily hydrolase (TIGR01490 family)